MTYGCMPVCYCSDMCPPPKHDNEHKLLLVALHVSQTTSSKLTHSLLTQEQVHVFGVIIINISRSVWVGCSGSLTVLYIKLLFKDHFKYLKRFPLRNEHSLISVGWNLCVGFCSARTTHSGSRHLSAQAIRQNRVLVKVDIRIRAAHSTETPEHMVDLHT